MKQLFSLLGSMKSMVVFMLIFAFSIGWATIVENDYGTMTAKADIYNARWFEVLLFLLAVNLTINIFKYKMYTVKKAPIFIFHIAFLIILLGSAITRYIGFEGTMHIREGRSADTMLSSKTYFTVGVESHDKDKAVSKPVYMSKKIHNSLSLSESIDGKEVSVSLIEYIPDAMEVIVKDSTKKAMVEMMVTGTGKGEPIILADGEYYDSGTFVLDFNSGKTFDKKVISIFVKDDKLFMKHTTSLSFLKMDTNKKGILEVNDKEPLTSRTLFSMQGGGFVLRKFYPHAKKDIISDPNASPMRPGYDAMRFEVSLGDKSKEMLIYGQEGLKAKKYYTNIDGTKVWLSYGAKVLHLPFSIYLKDFQLDRYPGSMSPSSYASEVVLLDKEKGIDEPFRIYMNHVLEHRGYRFFQASYDMDEMGTVLSVNHDPGTLPSYIGYFLLAVGMFWSLLSKKHRFAQLTKKAHKAANDKMVISFALLCLALIATPSHADTKVLISFDKKHTDRFAQLVVQDSSGRMKPMDTLTTEILAKIHRGDSIEIDGKKLDANQVVLGMMIRPDDYRDIKMIYTRDKAVNKYIGIDKATKYASFAQFFDDPVNMSGYKLSKAVDEAIRKEVKYRDKFDKAILKIDERVNIAYSVYTGSLMKLWPKPNDINNKWYSTIEALQTFSQSDAIKLREVAARYFSSIDESLKTGEWSGADKALQDVVKYQKFYGASVYVDPDRIKAEIFYNHSNLFETLFPLYLIVGFILLIFSFINILKPKLNIKLITKISLWILMIFFLVYTFGLGLRWFISGHAPWSNGYESMLYIGWATALAGFIFSKRSSITMASTAIMAGLILFIAHLNWMDPQVTNLVPVLNSYWLSIHVAVITASYGFLGLGALLGFITILLFVLINKKNRKLISLSIKELNAINEMSLMIGLVFLTIGNFLGGVWANESWGRYWGWDPKETWALVSILVYAVVVHLRFIKSIYSEFNYSVISLLSFTSVIMTYFGVNYYLAGMHSYAKGDPVPVPDFVPISYAIIFILIALAFRNRKMV